MSSKASKPKGRPVSEPPSQLRQVFSNEAVRCFNLFISWNYAYKTFGTEAFFPSMLFASFGFLTLRCNRTIYTSNLFVEKFGFYTYVFGLIVGLLGCLNTFHTGFDSNHTPIVEVFNNFIINSLYVWGIVMIGAIFDFIFLRTAEQYDIEVARSTVSK